MTSYVDLGYDSYLRKLPIEERQTYSALDFDSLLEDQAINTQNIQSRFLGKDALYDSQGNKIVDLVGLVGDQAFKYGSIRGAGSAVSTTGDLNFHSVTGVALTLTMDREGQVLVMLATAAVISGDGADTTERQAVVGVAIDEGTPTETWLQPYIYVMGSRLATTGAPTLYMGDQWMSHYVHALTPGKHEISVWFGTSNAAYTAYVYRTFTRLTYIKLGT